MVPIPHFLYLAFGLFAIGLVGATRRGGGLLARLIAVEIMLCGVHLTFSIFARAWGEHAGQSYALAVGVIAAAHAIVGAGLVVLIARARADRDADALPSRAS
ncbi:MAG: NADH-quinone oxidoreductase subunit K [Myxococcales bacterium]|nr:NADH-quinone oxidoreductase subunit K [Myxococcales bacterium]